MVSVMISLPDEVKKLMQQFAWVNWSELARAEVLKRQYALVKFNEMFKNSELTDRDVEDLSKKSRKGRFKDLKSRGLI
jgi:hypothetical protein